MSGTPHASTPLLPLGVVADAVILGDDGLDARMASLRRWGAAIILAVLALFLLWALAAPISGGVVAQGLVKVEANRLSISHRDGGTVARVLVREGQLVKQGELLLELADVRIEASVDMARSQLVADRLRQSRLEAEVAGAKTWRAPDELLREYAKDKRLLEQAAKERAAFTARQANLAGQLAGEARQAADTRTEIEIRLRERANADQAVALMKEELQVNERLEKDQFVNRTRVMSLQRAVSEYQSRQAANEAELSQARQRLGAIEARVQALRNGLMQQASEELREVSARISDNEQRLRATSDDQARQRVLAPEAGRLVNLRINTVGSAVGPREPIVDLVPSQAPLLIEARLPLDVAADVHPGMAAEVKALTAQARYEPLLPATVIHVAADAQQDERSGASYVLAQLQVPAAALAERRTALQPGMAAEIYIKVAERTPVGFLLEPIAGYFRRAFREH